MLQQILTTPEVIRAFVETNGDIDKMADRLDAKPRRIAERIAEINRALDEAYARENIPRDKQKFMRTKYFARITQRKARDQHIITLAQDLPHSGES